MNILSQTYRDYVIAGYDEKHRVRMVVINEFRETVTTRYILKQKQQTFLSLLPEINRVIDDILKPLIDRIVLDV